MKTKPKLGEGMEPFIKKNVREQIVRLRNCGTTAMSMDNLFQVTPTPPAHMANDEQNVREYRPLFEKIAAEVAERMNFPILK